MDHDSLLKELAKYHFYQTIDLGNGIRTPGRPLGAKQRAVLGIINSMDLSGKRVVDLGCANGLYAFAAEKRGADEILAVDHTRSNVECIEQVLIPYLKSKVRAVNANVLDMDGTIYGQFDVVIFAGVLYHLKYPFWGLKVVRDLTREGGTIILETGIFDDFNTRAALYCPSPTDTPVKTRGGNACSFFNEKALREALEYFGIRVLSRVTVPRCVRRLQKKLAGKLFRSYYPVSNIILHCERASSLEDQYLSQFYESTLQ